VVVSTGHTGTDLAVALSREAESLGADALMVLPPYFLKPDAEGVFQYFQAISDAVKIPVMVQDAPIMTGVSMSVELLARMHRDLPRVTLVKVEAPPTAPKVSALRAKAEGLSIFGGLDGYFLLEELGRGAVGTMPGSDLSDAFVRILDRFENGDADGAREDFARHLPLIRYELQPDLGVSAMKTTLKSRGSSHPPACAIPRARSTRSRYGRSGRSAGAWTCSPSAGRTTAERVGPVPPPCAGAPQACAAGSGPRSSEFWIRNVK
jgi:4-hydroxy-tetrahydrodipicolinate synthase